MRRGLALAYVGKGGVEFVERIEQTQGLQCLADGAPYFIGRPVSNVSARSSPSAGKRRPRSWLWDRSATMAYSPNRTAFSPAGKGAMQVSCQESGV